MDAVTETAAASRRTKRRGRHPHQALSPAFIRHAPPGRHADGNGLSRKTVPSDDGELVLSIPRDRHGRFHLALIRKYQRRFPGFDHKIIALYARGMSTRAIPNRTS